MKTIFTCILVLSMLLHFVAISQVADHTYTDCDGNSESIYGIISAGMPLVIASKGFDCSICMSQAGKVQDFASQHPEVRVWGAMNYKYASTTPECPALINWRTNYSWNDIFMFNDVNDEWQALSYPTYYVISPVDSSIAYQGPNFNSAEAEALSLASTGLKPAEESIFEITFRNNAIVLICNAAKCEGKKSISLLNVSGQIIFHDEIQFQTGQALTITIPEKFASGIYLAKISDNAGLSYSSRLMIQ